MAHPPPGPDKKGPPALAAELEARPEDVECETILEAIFRATGYDFRGYVRASIKRRLHKRMLGEKLDSISALEHRVLQSQTSMDRLLADLTVNDTEIFRDPSFYQVFRTKAVPLLRTHPFVRIWHAGCATGEEIYSMAILLIEEGLYDRSRLYGTDLSATALERAASRIVSLERVKGNEANYAAAGGKKSLDHYYTAAYGGALFSKSLMSNVVLSQHNLATDGSFNEFTVVLCRNVMIYFDKALQARVHRLIYDSLCLSGVLGIGDKESLHFSPVKECFTRMDPREKLYRKSS